MIIEGTSVDKSFAMALIAIRYTFMMISTVTTLIYWIRLK